MKIEFTQEILECLKKQYPNRWKNYNKLFSGGFSNLKEELEVYDDCMTTLSFMVDLIKELENKYR